MPASVRRTLAFFAGWILVLLGLIALVLPGPGLLLLLCGLVVLATEYTWAQRFVRPVEVRAVAVAHRNVQAWWSILLSALGAACLIGLGVMWGVNPRIPRLWIVGPDLPFGGWGVGTSLVGSGIIAMGLLVYAVVRYRGKPLPQPRLGPSDDDAVPPEAGDGGRADRPRSTAPPPGPGGG